MPINDPVRNRKIAPASLAFEGESKGAGAVFQVGETPVTNVYQDVTNIYLGDTNILYVTNQFIESNNDKIMLSMTNTEHRSKHYVSDYKRSTQWDLTQNQVIFFNQWSFISFNHEIIRTIGTQSGGTPINGTAYWQYIVPTDSEGSWWWYSHINIKFGAGTQVAFCRLGFFIDDILFRIVDMVDNNMMGENKIRDARLAGGCHVPLKAGNRFSVKIWVNNTVGGSDTSLFGDSVYAYVSGHRENCDGQQMINGPATGLQYTFDHNA